MRLFPIFILNVGNKIQFSHTIGFACVIDVGDQKASISCVEDGISHPDTRIHLDFGGSDISQVSRKSHQKCKVEKLHS